MICGECYEKIKDNENYIKCPNCDEVYHVGCENKKCKYCKAKIR